MSDELAPSVPSEPFDELFSLAYRFRCPVNYQPVLGSLNMGKLGCGTKFVTHVYTRGIPIRCAADKRTDQPIIMRRACGVRHKIQPAKLIRPLAPTCARTKQAILLQRGAKLCGNRRSIMPRKLKRMRMDRACRVNPSNLEFPLRKLRCATRTVATAIKLLKMHEKVSAIGCRTYHKPLFLLGVAARCHGLAAIKFTPIVVASKPSILCNVSERVRDAGNIKIGGHIFICPKKFTADFVKPVHLSWSLQCATTGVSENFDGVKNCEVIKPTRAAPASAPLYAQVRVYGKSCHTYPLGAPPGEAVQGYRMCGTRPKFGNAEKTYPFQIHTYSDRVCKVFPLATDITNKRARCGTIWLADAPLLIYGRVWGGASPFLLAATNGRVGANWRRNK